MSFLSKIHVNLLVFGSVFFAFAAIAIFGLRINNDLLVWSSVGGVIIIGFFCVVDFLNDDEEDDDALVVPEPPNNLKVPLPPVKKSDDLVSNDEVSITHG